MRRWIIFAVALVLAACNFGVPQVTPTVAPSRTPTQTPLATFTPTRELTEIALRQSPSPTPPTETDMPASPPPATTEPPTVTPLPLLSLTPSVTPTQTPSHTPTATTIPPAETSVPVLTPVPLQPTATQSTGGEPTRTLSPEELAQFMTPVAFRTPLVTNEPITPPPGPTLDVTPTFVTQDAPAVVVQLTPVLATTTPQAQPSPTLLPIPPTSTDLPVNPVPQVVDLPPLREIIVPETIAYSLSTGTGVIGVQPVSLNINPEIFAQNPANPNQYIAVNAAGQMHFISDFAAGTVEQIDIPMFTRYTYEVTTREENNAAVAAVDWARDGTLAFIVDGDSIDFDGVWLWSPGGSAIRLLRDCPPSCELVLDTAGLTRWESRSIDWSPQSDALLIKIGLLDEGRDALLVARRDTPNEEAVPAPVLRYDYGSWSPDGQRLIVSGRGPDGRVVMGSINRDGSGENLTLAETHGFRWARDAVEYNGRVYALASRGGPDAPHELITADGEAISGQIGNGPPVRVSWSPDHSAVLVVTSENGALRHFIAHVDPPALQEISMHVANSIAVDWVNETPPVPDVPDAPPSVEPDLPALPDVELTAFQPGEVVHPLELLNLRTAPSESAEIIAVLQPEQALTIIRGPQPAEGHEWYEVEVDGSLRGWVAGVASGDLMLQPEVRG
ncbi:MAG: SH3 domain-containing protein [Chloroflexota bacterium]